ncbi:MAG: hypothetical protein ACE5KO_04445, partial [Candidatus Bathyarchaeia archaeon]
MSQFKHLFTPIKIGPVTVRNRIFSVHSTGFAEPIPGEPEVMLPSERHAYFYRERAKGGLGLIIAEASHVHPSSDYLFQSHLYDPRGIPMLRKSAESVHEFGGKIFMQLQHAGHHTHNHRSMLPALSSSQSPDVASHSIPKEMEIEDIKEVQNAFAISANNAKEAGFDGFELHGTHSYLIEQFLSPFYNKRQDEYGGSTENRMRFVVELLERIRQKIGYDVALGIRMNIDEMLPGGLKIDETQILARKLEDTRLIDFLDVDVGTYHTLPFMIAPMNMPPLHQVDFISEIKKVVKKIPVLGCPGRLTDPRDAERLLSEGHMDMVGGARVHIADPEWANKAFNGRLDDIIKCIACNWCLTR